MSVTDLAARRLEVLLGREQVDGRLPSIVGGVVRFNLAAPAQAPPHDAPAPADLGKLMSGELVSPPRLKNAAIPKVISDIVMKALSPEVANRYQRATDLMEDVLAARTRRPPRPGKVETPGARTVRDDSQGIQNRLRARESPAARFCWQCRKPLHARTDRCPFCNEQQ